jgi:hypothetical protein
VTILSFNAYAGTLESHNSGVSITGDWGTGSRFGWVDDWVPHAWIFVAQTSGIGQFWAIPGGAAENYLHAVRLEVVVDGVANEVYGRYDVGHGLFETPHFGVADSDISDASKVSISQDFRGTFGAEFDNILVATQVAAIPEPSTYALVLSALVALSIGRIRRQSRRSD